MRPVSRCGLRLANSCRFSSSSSSSFVRFTSPAIRASIGQRSTASPHAVAGRQSDEGMRAGDGAGSGDHDLADLNLRGEGGVVGDITDDLLAVGTDALLEVGGGIEVGAAHSPQNFMPAGTGNTAYCASQQHGAGTGRTGGESLVWGDVGVKDGQEGSSGPWSARAISPGPGRFTGRRRGRGTPPGSAGDPRSPEGPGDDAASPRRWGGSIFRSAALG